MTPAPEPGERRAARRLLLIYLWLWLMEGVLRKWLMPSLQQPLYFVRIVVVIAVVVYALSRLRRPWPWPTHAGIGFVIVVTLFTAAHVISGAQSLTQAVLGTRLWLELVLTPLALGPMLARRDVLSAANHIIAASFGIAPIALLQVISPAAAPVNRIFESDGSDNFGNEGGVVRATGLFTSSAGHSAFVVLAASAVLVAMLSPEATRFSRRIAMGCMPVVLLMATTSGSRSAVFGLGVIIVVATPVLLRGGGKDAVRVGMLAGVALGLALWLGPKVAPDAIAGIVARFAGDGTVAEPSERVFSAFFGWILQIPDAPTWGRGLGSTAQGLGNLSATKQPETELDQWMVQLGPPIFVMALAARIVVITLVVRLALVAVRRGANQAAPLLALFLIFWPSGPIASQGSINGVGVLAAVLLMGLVNHGDWTLQRDASGDVDARDRQPQPLVDVTVPNVVRSVGAS